MWLKLHALNASQLIAVSHFLRQELKSDSNIIVIHDPLPFVHAHGGGSFESCKEKRSILYVAQIIRGKGQDHGLRAFSLIASRHPEWRIRFVGGDMGLEKNQQFKNELLMLANSLNLEDQVQWIDFTANVKSEYLASAFVINFSESESFSLTCLEALAFGRTVVATRCGGPEEIISDGDSGFLVPKGDIYAMANAMEVLMENSRQREQFARNGFEDVTRRFGFQETTGKLERVYSEAIGL
jgi:glycosyltransferase involved in cell wall biosynthesis